MFRKLCVLLLSLALLLTAAHACAESIFTLPTEDEAAIPAPATAPNYGLMADAQPVTRTTLEDGSLQLVYKPVTDDDFLAFGALLGERDFTVTDRSAEAGEVTTTVRNGDMAFTVAYLSSSSRLTVTYPADMPIEQPVLVNPFTEGYIRLELGETLRAYNSNGEPQFDLKVAAIYKGRDTHGLNLDADYALGFTLDVLDNEEFYLHSSFSPSLHYITTDNSYTYPRHTTGYKKADGNFVSLWGFHYNSYGHNYNYVTPLSFYSDCYVAFHAHERIFTADDGIVAVTFTLPGYELPFVLYIRGGN